MSQQNGSRRKRKRMSTRHFTNTLSDSDESVLNTPFDYWRTTVDGLTERVSRNAPSSSKNTLYTGTTGIAYMFYRLSVAEAFGNGSTAFLNRAAEVLKLKQNNCDKHKLGRFICGDAGVNAVAAAIYRQFGQSDHKKLARTYLERFQNGVAECKPIDSVEHGEDELFVGRAGYLCGVLWLEKIFGRKIIPDQDVIDVCSTIVESGRNYSEKNNSTFPLMFSYHGKEYLGAAHGLSMILLVLISFPHYIEVELQARDDIKKCIDQFLTLQTTNGNFPTRILEYGAKQRSEEDELIHWCHGAPGVIYLFAKAYLVFKEPSYLECCLKCGDLVWTKGLLKKGPGLCHGIAGNGYVFLLLYRLTGDTKHLRRAIQFGKFLFTEECIQGSRTPDNPYSLYEGLAGTVCYLVDLTQPEKASFPFLDVF